MLVQFAEKARMEGLLALEDELPGIESTFIKNGLRLVVDGCDPQRVHDICVTRMRAGHFDGWELLMRMVATSGILGIQQGLSPNYVREEMMAHLGERLEPDYSTPPAVHGQADPEKADDKTGFTPNRVPVNEMSPGANISIPMEDEECRQELEKILSANRRIVSSEPVSEQEIGALAEAVKSSGQGVRTLIMLLGSRPAELSSQVMRGFEEYAPELYEQIMQKWFVFEDLAACGDRVIQKVLREVDTQDLAKAFKGASPAVQEKIFANMSKRAAALLREDIKYMGPIRLEDVEESQNRIIRIVHKLGESGDILIARPGERFV
ncbi:MAG: hypothetical protein EPN93_02675 [Spirochaetes bacterium]|nr:MAG: hypothetical protein EPN93_02675 [Spirochaetota bacterium]